MDHACAIFLKSPSYKDPKNDAPSPWVCYSVVWYCMLGHGMVWVLSIDGCSLQMGAKGGGPYAYCKLFPNFNTANSFFLLQYQTVSRMVSGSISGDKCAF